MSYSIPRKSRWTDTLSHPIQVLEHAESLRLDKFTAAELDDLGGCIDIWRLELRRDLADEPIDLALIASISGLQQLWLERVKIKNLSALVDLPHLRYLILKDCRIAPYDELKSIHLNWPVKLSLEYDSQAPGEWIKECMQLYATSTSAQALTNELIPIGSVSVSDYKCDDGSGQIEANWQALLQLGMPDTREVAAAGSSQLVEQMLKGDWNRVHAVNDLPLWSKALSHFFDSHPGDTAIRGVLAHPAPVFHEEAILCGLGGRYTKDIKLVVQVFSEQGEGLLAPLQKGVVRYLKHWGHNDFDVGKLHVAHFTIAAILKNVSAPAFTPLYLQLMNEREQFSQIHLRLYKELLDSVAKTKSPLLVEPIIDLLRFEKRVIGGDAAFVKKVFKAIGQLGQYTDAPFLESSFDVASETRLDVIDAYEWAIARLRKKQK